MEFLLSCALAFSIGMGMGIAKYFENPPYFQSMPNDVEKVIKYYSFPRSSMLVFISTDLFDEGFEFIMRSGVSVAMESIADEIEPERVTQICLPIEALTDGAVSIKGMKFVMVTSEADIPRDLDDSLVVRNNQEKIMGYFSEEVDSTD